MGQNAQRVKKPKNKKKANSLEIHSPTFSISLLTKARSAEKDFARRNQKLFFIVSSSAI